MKYKNTQIVFWKFVLCVRYTQDSKNYLHQSQKCFYKTVEMFDLAASLFLFSRQLSKLGKVSCLQ